MRVSTADFIKHYGALADRALAEPITITKNGRDRLVVMSADEYSRLKRRERKALLAEELSDEELKLIAESEPPAGLEHLDSELEGWKR
ncbi:type II toxin-antitoxin system Phd/YefM family antitoxin [Bosea caraganae]|uniref:Antitoxin n=1 Tax=Bosea caraganae TaxID=2763117 RepID=A0A370L7V5_9HYPH|nr:type II toxin-antitoxin system prevent-host-death family antitoxin [Bosea caraganae]RDJ25016.1 type II toxin-antitoxin system Phd/YefM family antitoxin [Bosea caraganae]RDJ26126.1 type II toxin-antitoxin system Phd/YefM family antitoxin [Bosea caraganae]